MSRGRLVLALLACGGAVLAASSAVWLEAVAPTATGATAVTLTGAAAAPAVTAAGLVILAGALALSIAGVVVGQAAAVAVALTSLGALVQAVRVVMEPTPPLEAGAATVTGVSGIMGEPTVNAPAWVAVVALGVASVLAIVATRAVGSWARGGERFERREAVTAADARTRAMDDWDALGRGEDPSGGDGSLDARRIDD